MSGNFVASCLPTDRSTQKNNFESSEFSLKIFHLCDILFNRIFSYDGLKFEKAQNSYYAHTETLGLGNYRGSPFTTGCNPNAMYVANGCHHKTEIFNMENMMWFSDKSIDASSTYDIPPDYPFSTNGIYHYSTTNTPDAVFIIGGAVTGQIVAEFRDYQWKHIADLRQPRSRHSSIALGSQTIIIGGEHDFSYNNDEDISTEVWDFENGMSRTMEPSFQIYAGDSIGISLYFVDDNFCSSSDSTYDPWGSTWGSTSLG